MTTILVTTDSIPAVDLGNCVEALNQVLAMWAPAWGIATTAVLTSPKPDMVIRITDTNRHKGAYGYHTVEAGVPTSYCSPRAIGRTYGHYTPAFWTKAKKNLLGKVTTPATMIHGELFTEGLVSVIIHEALEMLADAHIDTYSKPDLQGRDWLVEVCDHMSGFYSTLKVNGNVCVIPNATLPSYYDLNGKAPYDLFKKVSTPFSRQAPKFYGYYKDSTGKLVAL